MGDGHLLQAVDTNRDERFMREALALARRIPARPWPNPPVGALVVHGDEVLAGGAHEGAGTAHAEAVALAGLGDRSSGATLYCTLEPCNHHGRTPPCTEAILAAGIERVVCALRDPNPIAGGGVERLRAEGVEVTVGVLADDALELVWPYVCSDQFRRPYVELKTAMSLDGRFGPAGAPIGRPAYLTGEMARRDVHRRRRWFDLVLVGHNTARRDRPRLDIRLSPEPELGPLTAPEAGVVAGDGAPDAPLDRERWFVFHGDTAGVRVPADADGVPCRRRDDGTLDPRDVITAAASRGVQTILLEGGPRLAASFLAAGLVDRWVQYTAPLVLGDGPSWAGWPVDAVGSWSLHAVGRLGSDVCAVWDRPDLAIRREVLLAGGVG